MEGSIGAAQGVAVGVDGGGTSTRVLLMDPAGGTLGVGASGSGNLHDIGENQLRAHLDAAWRQAWEVAGQAPREGAAVFCAMASVGTPGNRETVQRLVADVGMGPLDQVEVDVDLAGALAGGLGGKAGVALIAGTGSSCYGKDHTGAAFQCGGWGSLLDDVGGATWMGVQAMVAAVRAYDGRGVSTVLSHRVMEHFGLGEMRELLPKVDADGMGRSAIAQLAKIVTAAALDNDEAAVEILKRGADALAECVEAVVRQLDFPGRGAIEVVATGGLAENSSQYTGLIHQAVVRRVPRAVCVKPRMSNVEGAATLARARILTREG